MTNLLTLTRNFYLLMLSSLAVFATWFAMMSSNACWTISFYQPKMPASLIIRDE